MIICNCSEPGKIQKENVTDVFIHELFSFEFYLDLNSYDYLATSGSVLFWEH